MLLMLCKTSMAFPTVWLICLLTVHKIAEYQAHDKPLLGVWDGPSGPFCVFILLECISVRAFQLPNNWGIRSKCFGAQWRLRWWF
ncbi:hypothetical protein ARMA_0984 [Ardenticatena maritima]|uniref:Uncharacterized protein n=1 Tax=Ardenticatena maritima TaxID=872965 RepID=A0A0M8K7S9_9CHLR|nr:hypothetical protein ARMA_0984 [Ardenticatena maritima]